jgi:hypothetical protein
MRARLDHVGILVESLENVTGKLKDLGLTCTGIEEFPSEGTREMYCGGDASSGRLLFLQPMGEGPYASALERRGPGLHHIALHVENLERFIGSLAGSGWYLHTTSLESIRGYNTAWLARPAIPTLLEITQPESVGTADDFLVSKIEIPIENRHSLVDALGIAQIAPSTDQHCWLTIADARLSVDSLT